MKRIFVILLLMAFIAVPVFSEITISTDGATNFQEFTGTAGVAWEEYFGPIGISAGISNAIPISEFSWDAGLKYKASAFELGAVVAGSTEEAFQSVTFSGDLSLSIFDFYGQAIFNFPEFLFGGAEVGAKMNLGRLSVLAGYWIGPGSEVNTPHGVYEAGELFFSASIKLF